jgi:hypothetical protein
LAPMAPMTMNEGSNAVVRSAVKPEGVVEDVNPIIIQAANLDYAIDNKEGRCCFVVGSRRP